MKDWNINDSKNSGYIENRTHWKEVSPNTVTVGGPSCGFHGTGSTAENTIEYIYASGNQAYIQLDESTRATIYGPSIIEVMYDKSGVKSYHVQEVVNDYCLVDCLYGLGIYRNNPSKMAPFSKFNEEFNDNSMDEIRNTLWAEVGDLANDENLGSWGGHAPTQTQRELLEGYINTHVYTMCGGYLYFSGSSMKLLNPSNTWKTYWGAVAGVNDIDAYYLGYALVEEHENGADCEGPLYTLQITNSSSQHPENTTEGLHFLPIPMAECPESYNIAQGIEGVEYQVTAPEDLNALAAAATCSSIGLDSAISYHPVTYHPISLEMLSPEIKKMYAWYLRNRDAIQAAITEPSEPSEPDPGTIK